MDDEEFFSKRGPKYPIELTHESERLFKASVLVVRGWALIEEPLELGGLINSTSLLAMGASKVLTGLIGRRHRQPALCPSSLYVHLRSGRIRRCASTTS
jgi:hypothetical protein